MRSVKENKSFVIEALNAHFTDGNSYIRETNGAIEINDEEGKLNSFMEFCADQLSNPGSLYNTEYYCEGNNDTISSWEIYEQGLIRANISKTSSLSKIYVEEFGDGNVW